eukprot:m.19941 g.19941  ORF g.19941 m.19941 type:complete len:196 (-) comp7708_c0_seq1:23-610(-)
MIQHAFGPLRPFCFSRTALSIQCHSLGVVAAAKPSVAITQTRLLCLFASCGHHQWVASTNSAATALWTTRWPPSYKEQASRLHTSAHYRSSPTHESFEKKKKTIRELAHLYGRPAVVVYMGVGTAILGCCYVAVLCHVDVPWLLEHVGLTLPPHAGNLLVAYLFAKLFLPVHVALTAALTPSCAPHLKRWFPRWM